LGSSPPNRPPPARHELTQAPSRYSEPDETAENEWRGGNGQFLDGTIDHLVHPANSRRAARERARTKISPRIDSTTTHVNTTTRPMPISNHLNIYATSCFGPVET
jgi:hypothetical protein